MLASNKSRQSQKGFAILKAMLFNEANERSATLECSELEVFKSLRARVTQRLWIGR